MKMLQKVYSKNVQETLQFSKSAFIHACYFADSESTTLSETLEPLKIYYLILLTEPLQGVCGTLQFPFQSVTKQHQE